MLAVRFSAQLTRGSRRGQSEIDGLFKTSDGTVWHQSCAKKHVLALSLLTNKRELYLSCRLHILPTYKLYVKTHLIYQLHWKCVSTIGLPSRGLNTSENVCCTIQEIQTHTVLAFPPFCLLCLAGCLVSIGHTGHMLCSTQWKAAMGRPLKWWVSERSGAIVALYLRGPSVQSHWLVVLCQH